MKKKLTVALSIIAFTLAAGSAPAAEFEKFLPDDTNGVVVVNMKQLLASPLYKKNYEKMVKDFLGGEQLPKEMKAMLKETGFDPSKDLDQFVMTVGDYVLGERNVRFPGLEFMTGKFDRAKFEAGIAKVAKDNPKKCVIHKEGAVSILEIKAGGSVSNEYFAVPAANLLLHASEKESIVSGLEMVAGKKKSNPKHPKLRELLKQLDTKKSISFVMSETNAMASEFRGLVPTMRNDEIKGMKEQLESMRLQSYGIESLTGALNVTDDFTFEFSFTAKDEATAKKLAKTFDDAKKVTAKAIEDRKKFADVISAVEKVSIDTKAKAIRVHGGFSGAAGANFVTGLFSGELFPAPKKFKEVK